LHRHNKGIKGPINGNIKWGKVFKAHMTFQHLQEGIVLDRPIEIVVWVEGYRQCPMLIH
jgi:hypothetical protein